MKKLASLLALIAFTLPVYADLLDSYVARGFASRDAMLSAFFALPPEQQATVIVQAQRETSDCAWDEPWVMIYRGATDETSSKKYQVTTFTPFDAWSADLYAARFWHRARVYQTGDEARPAIVVRYVGSYCTGLP
jgi:hypothetical protein